MPDAGQESKISRGWGESRQPRLRSAKAERVSAGAVLPGEAPQLPEVPGLLVHLAVERESLAGQAHSSLTPVPFPWSCCLLSCPALPSVVKC